ncbi:hypothetical protein D3C80_1767890 [compost metagenome]
MRGALVQLEVVARRAHRQRGTHAQLLVHVARAAAAAAVQQHAHGVAVARFRRAAQRVAAHQAVAQVQVDMGARAVLGQGLAFGILQFDADHAARFITHGLDAQGQGLVGTHLLLPSFVVPAQAGTQ